LRTAGQDPGPLHVAAAPWPLLMSAGRSSTLCRCCRPSRTVIPATRPPRTTP